VISTVFVRFTFEGWHRWPDAPPEHDYLAARHRHLFHVEAHAHVDHHNRDLEFIALKRKLLAWCLYLASCEVGEHLGTTPTTLGVGSWSCETWALQLLQAHPVLTEVSFSEDGENGARLVRP